MASSLPSPPEKSTLSPPPLLQNSTPLPPPISENSTPLRSLLEKSTPLPLPPPKLSSLPPPPNMSTPPLSPLLNQTLSQPPSKKPSPSPTPPMSPSQSLALVVQQDFLNNSTEPNPNLNNGSSNVTIGSLLAMSDLTMAKAKAAPPPVPRRVRLKEMSRLELGLRVSALVLCLISFSLMAADSVPGWDGDSFNRFGEYIYLLSINVIGCTYSLFQVIDEVHQMMKRRHFISRPIGFCFNLAMDQILAYLLLSASSAATSQNSIWISRFGGDGFTKMVDASVSISFLAFFVLALSSVFSAHNLFSFMS